MFLKHGQIEARGFAVEDYAAKAIERVCASAVAAGWTIEGLHARGGGEFRSPEGVAWFWRPGPECGHAGRTDWWGCRREDISVAIGFRAPTEVRFAPPWEPGERFMDTHTGGALLTRAGVAPWNDGEAPYTAPIYPVSRDEQTFVDSWGGFWRVCLASAPDAEAFGPRGTARRIVVDGARSLAEAESQGIPLRADPKITDSPPIQRHRGGRWREADRFLCRIEPAGSVLPWPPGGQREVDALGTT